MMITTEEDSQEMQRCEWASNAPLTSYHDLEWGVPIHDDRSLFEFLILEGMQAGLSWETILRRRDSYRAAFDDFDASAIAAYDRRKMRELLANQGIIRNRLKVEAAVQNARLLLAVRKEFGSFDDYLWRFVNRYPKQNNWQALQDVPVQTPESNALSKSLRHYGFKFVGPVICYAFMQAVGMVNDHLAHCFRYEEIKSLGQ
jgi:DNA-3-methyladenine glycosylase I